MMKCQGARADLGEASNDSGHRDSLGNVVSHRLAAKLVDGRPSRAGADVAPEHAGGRVIDQGLRA